jgi:hypothetical protein
MSDHLLNIAVRAVKMGFGGAAGLAAILLCVVAVSGQTPVPKCPDLKLEFRHRISPIDQPNTIYVVYPADFDSDGISYEWRVSRGSIVLGEGTRVIDFVPSGDDAGKTADISVTISGLPSGCRNTVIETLPIDRLPIGEPVDHIIGKIGTKPRDRERLYLALDSYLAQLALTPTYEGYIVIEFDRNDSSEHKRKYLRRIVEHLKFRKFDLNRITFVISTTDGKEITTLWTAAPNAYLSESFRKPPFFKAEEYGDKIEELIPD